MAEDRHPYKVYKDGECVLAAEENCRYPKRVELDLMEAGYVIRLHGKRITKREVRDAKG
jgi:hypothetical protein